MTNALRIPGFTFPSVRMSVVALAQSAALLSDVSWVVLHDLRPRLADLFHQSATLLRFDPGVYATISRLFALKIAIVVLFM